MSQQPQAVPNNPQPGESGKKPFDPYRWKAGRYKAKAIDWAIHTTPNGKDAAVVLFAYDQPGAQPGTTEPVQLRWTGWLSGGATPITLKTLVALGLKTSMEHFNEGRPGGALNIEKAFDIEVVHESYEGKVNPRIKSVRDPESSFIGGIDREKAKVVAMQYNNDLNAALLEAGIQPQKGGAPIAGSATPAQAAAMQGTFSEDDIPF